MFFCRTTRVMCTSAFSDFFNFIMSPFEILNFLIYTFFRKENFLRASRASASYVFFFFFFFCQEEEVLASDIRMISVVQYHARYTAWKVKNVVFSFFSFLLPNEARARL
jgi:hypothetical protein